MKNMGDLALAEGLLDNASDHEMVRAAQIIRSALGSHQSVQDARALLFVLTHAMIVYTDGRTTAPLTPESAAHVLSLARFGERDAEFFMDQDNLSSDSFWLGFITALQGSIFAINPNDQHLVNLIRYKLQDEPSVEQVVLHKV